VRKAVIDVGSNSVLLVVEELREGGWHPVHEATAVTALGEGTKSTGLLGEPGMTATLDALARFFEKARELGAESITAAATMAARIAMNTPDFLARAEAQETPVVVLSGEDEAELGFHSVADDPLFAQYSRLSIVDPGGHSTELMTADRIDGRWEVRFRRSYPVGTLGLKSTVLTDESPGVMQILAAVEQIDDLIGLAYLPRQCGHVVVLGATGTNLVTIRERMTGWDPERVHGQWLDYEEVSKAVGWMMPMTDAERADIVGMEPGREKTLPAGALILERFLHCLRALGCSVSVRGWRHALLEKPPRPSGGEGVGGEGTARVRD
jgi:exopolyphosphatase/guanosine-5'-triphosphate,3'-diphosphate pyrophosphatase